MYAGDWSQQFFFDSDPPPPNRFPKIGWEANADLQATLSLRNLHPIEIEMRNFRSNLPFQSISIYLAMSFAQYKYLIAICYG
jgi:hypothetical protein